MKALYQIFAEVKKCHTMPSVLVYSIDLDHAKAKAVRLFTRDYGASQFKIRDSATRSWTDPIEAENNIGIGQSIIGSLCSQDVLPFLRDYAKFSKGQPKRKGSNIDRVLLDELKREELKEKKRIAEERELLASQPVSDNAFSER